VNLSFIELRKNSFQNPESSVPDAEPQRQNDSWATQWGLFEFPGKDSDSQDSEYYANDFRDH
jgi:hypothetical protein